ncbi:MAG TPA: rhamnan synthesis F family protein [Fimbriimonadaceae bacterium]|jgi:rhamnosyltransferase
MSLSKRLKKVAARYAPGLLLRLGVYKNRVYIPTLTELNYTPLPRPGETFSTQNEVVSDYLQRGWKYIIEGNYLNLRFQHKGKNYDYVEPLYLAANPDVAEGVRQGHFKHGLDHFLRSGYAEIKAGAREPYNETAFLKIERKLEGGASPEGRYLCLFAHYDPDELVDPYVIRYLEELRKIGCDIVFISGSVNDEALEQVRPLCVEIIIRGSLGRDFGSWYLALKNGWNLPDKYEFIIWANDSVYFPVKPVDNLIESIKERQFDFWGITDSRQAAKADYHIQSYFLGFSREAAKAGMLDDFIAICEKHPVLSKYGQIDLFELGLTHLAIEKCLRVGALCNIEEAYLRAPKKRKLPPISIVNPTSRLWDVLIEDFNCPVLKQELVRDNPEGAFSWNEAERLIDSSFYDLALITAHLTRLRKRTSESAELKLLHTINRTPFTGTDKLCIFAHFDPAGRIAPYVLRYLRSLEELGSEIIFVTALDNEEEFSKLPAACKRILVKNEAGRDFGSWYLGLNSLEPELLKYSTYIIANDSVYFPVADEKKMFAQMEAEGFDFWGVVESEQLAWHMMSYLWIFRSEAFVKEFLPRFLREYVPSYMKWEQIRNYEMRYPLLLKREGYKVGAYTRIADVDKMVRERYPNHRNRFLLDGGPFNSHVDFWEIIAGDLNCPCMKVELVRDNPTQVDNLYLLPQVVSKAATYDYALIEEHMKSLGKSAPA